MKRATNFSDSVSECKTDPESTANEPSSSNNAPAKKKLKTAAGSKKSAAKI
jgi:hypothetical protein